MPTYYERERETPPNPLATCLVLMVVLLALLGLGVWWFWPFGAGGGLDPNAQPRPVVARGDLSQAEKNNIEVYDKVSPSVAHVTNLTERSGGLSFDVQEVPQG